MAQAHPQSLQFSFPHKSTKAAVFFHVGTYYRQPKLCISKMFIKSNKEHDVIRTDFNCMYFIWILILMLWNTLKRIRQTQKIYIAAQPTALQSEGC